MLGAQSINPDFKVKVVWVSTWFDPGKEADAAKVLIGQGADIITQHTDSTAPLQIAADQGVVGFGQASDMIAFATGQPAHRDHRQLGALLRRARQGGARRHLESVDVWDGMAPGMVEMAPYTNLPDDVVAMAKETEARITSGEFHPFSGPIYKQDGTMAIGEGEVLDDGTLLGMNWYVQGIDDKLPQ